MPETLAATVSTTTSTSTSADAAAGFFQAVKLAFSKLAWADVLYAAVLLIVCCIAAKILMRLLRGVLDRSSLSENLRLFFEKTLRFALYFITVLIVADSLGIPVTSLLAVFSLLGLALSLSLQNLLGNLISGVVLLFNRPFEEDDYIEINGIAGTVKRVDLIHTLLNSVDNKLIYIPNSDVLSSTITNYSGENSRRVDVSFFASYDVPVETVQAAIRDCAASIGDVLADPAPEIVVSAFKESNVEYTARLWVRAGTVITVRDLMNARILTYFHKHGVTFSYPRVTVER